MDDIRYVCLSDMHFGAETSLLTNLQVGSDTPDPSGPSPVLKQLVACLRHLIAQNQKAKPRHRGDRPGPFYTRIDGLVREAPDIFGKFSDAVARAVNVRAQNLRARIRSQGF
jgi:hypothetical protein